MWRCSDGFRLAMKARKSVHRHLTGVSIYVDPLNPPDAVFVWLMSVVCFSLSRGQLANLK